MLGWFALVCLIGLGCGAVHGGWLLLVLHVTAKTRGVWRKVLILSWQVHVWAPMILATFVVPSSFVRPSSGFLCYACSYVVPFLGPLIWYMRTHPNPLQIEWGKPKEQGGKSSAPAPVATELPAVGVEGAEPRRVPYAYAVTAAGSGVVALYLVLSRRAFVHYFLAATGCGLGLGVYALLFLRAIRYGTAARRRALLLLTPSGMVLYFALGIVFRIVGRRLGLAGDLAAELGVPFLLGVPLVWVVLWYVHRYAPSGSRQAAGRGV